MKTGRNRTIASTTLRGLAAAVALSWSGLSAATYLDHPEMSAFMDKMVKEHGFTRADLEKYFASAEQQQRILDAIAKPAEKTMEWKDYRKIFMTEERITKGREFLVTHADTFTRAEAEYGVSRYVVAAIIGVETRYGKFMGNYRVIDALSTLGFDYPPRSKFFRSELEQYLLLTREQGFDPLVMTGSYAGAMGYGQFIPSSYRNFAVDFDGDGHADILNNQVDAIGSVANYFRRHHWQSGQPAMMSVTVEGKGYEHFRTTELRPAFRLSELMAQGVRPREAVMDDPKVKLIEVIGENGPEFRVGFDNFYVITRYNRSHLYAMAVNDLAAELAKPQ